MYLFTRRTRIVGGNGTKGLDWAMSTTAKVKAVTGHEVQLWATMYSPNAGEVTWTAWFDDLTALETLSDKLQAEPSFVSLANDGAKFTDGTLDDSIYQPIHGQPDPSRDVQYVGTVLGVLAAGNYEKGIGVGIEIAKMAEKVTGQPTTFASALTGLYGAVGFMTGYENIGAFEAAQNALAGDAKWIKFVDSTQGCFVEDAAITQQTLHRRIA
jgi:hypothetical protein